MDKITKLSQAMRLGATGTYQVKGTYWNRGFGVCAMGAATRGVTGEFSLSTYDFRAKFKDELSLRMTHPDADCPYVHPVVLETIIISLNDRYGWTIDRIAKWLEDQGL